MKYKVDPGCGVTKEAIWLPGSDSWKVQTMSVERRSTRHPGRSADVRVCACMRVRVRVLAFKTTDSMLKGWGGVSLAVHFEHV